MTPTKTGIPLSDVSPLTQIFLYTDQGTSTESIAHTQAWCRQMLPEARLHTIRAADIIIRGCLRTAPSQSVLIMPGGRDRGYTALLHGPGDEEIVSFVQQGGRYLGICAGAYYACDHVLFHPTGPDSICQPRSLRLFPGPGIGPVLAPYDATNRSGVRASRIALAAPPLHGPLAKPFAVYYHGGGTFIARSSMACDHQNVKVVAWYEDKVWQPAYGSASVSYCPDLDPQWIHHPLPAVVFASVKKGWALLSGVHFEYDPQALQTWQAQKPVPDPYLPAILDQLIPDDQACQHFGQMVARMLTSPRTKSFG